MAVLCYNDVMSQKQKTEVIIRSCAAALFIMVFGCAWDIWWHVAIGRDTFLEPPHIPVYLSLTYLLAVSGLQMYRTRDRQWIHLFASVALLPVAASFDQLWHEIFGVEDISEVIAVTSPPHLMLVAGMFLSALCILALLHRDKNHQAQEFFGSLIFACLLTLGLFYTLPFHPSFGWAILGYGGAGIVSFVFIFVTLCAANWKPTFAGGTLASLVFMLFYSIAFGAMTVGSNIIINPHDRAPIWLFALACLAPASLIDFMGRRYNALNTAAAGLLFGIILFGCSSAFFKPEFQYGMDKAAIAIIACAAGGAIAGVLMRMCQKKLSFLR
jgi:hypothetical protein